MNTTSRTFLAILTLVVSTVAVALPVRAQWRNFSIDGQSMTEEDHGQQQAAAQVFLNAEPPRPGTIESWSNPESGARGTITLLETRQIHGLPCRALGYATMTRGRTGPIEMTFTLCRTVDGTWKIAG